MWRNVAMGVALVGLLAGCSVGGGSGAVSDPQGATGSLGGPDTTGSPQSVTIRARVELARLRLLPETHIPAIGELRCVENHRVVVCHGATNTGDAAVAKFRAYADGSLGADGSLAGAECVSWGNTQDQTEWEYHSHSMELICPT